MSRRNGRRDVKLNKRNASQRTQNVVYCHQRAFYVMGNSEVSYYIKSMFENERDYGLSITLFEKGECHETNH